MSQPKNTTSDLVAIIAYSRILPLLINIGRECGYAIAVHGSYQRDLDILAVPWVVEAISAEELISAIKHKLGLHLSSHPEIRDNGSPRAHGRRAWSFYFDSESAAELDGPYIDISVMPRGKICGCLGSY